MLSVDLACRLRDAGLVWKPASGDRFVVTEAEMADDVFVLADMTIEVHQLPEGDVIGFNGTTEWALDSVDNSNAVWLPRESQLRDLLGGTFRRLERDGDGWRLTMSVNGAETTIRDQDPEQAYGRALLHLIELGR